MAINPITQTALPLGLSVMPAQPVSAPVRAFSLSLDCALWLLPASIELVIEASYDGGASWQRVCAARVTDPPPWPQRPAAGTTSTFTLTTTYDQPVTPSHVRWSALVDGTALTLGLATLTVS